MAKAWLHIKALRRLGEHGFSPVEALLAATIFGFLATALIGSLVYGRQATNEAGNRSRAVMLAEEGTEAVRNIRDASYSNLVDGTYGLAQSGNTWAFSGSSDTSGIYTRQTTVASNGTNRKTITSTVTWPQVVGTAQTSVTTQLTNWLATVTRSWLSPSTSGSLDIASTNDGLKVATQGNYAYVVRNDGTPDFAVIDISNPASPTLVGSLSLSGAPTNVAVSGNYAYVTTTDDAAELRIINIATPSAPAITGTYNASGTADGKGVFVSGNYAYIVRSANGGTDEFVAVNITAPSAPTRAGGYGLNVNMYEVYVNGTNAFITTGSDSQEVVKLNLTLISLIALGSTINLPGTVDATTIAGNGNTLYVGQGSVFYTIDGSVFSSPSGSVTLSGSAAVLDITLHSTLSYAFVGTNSSTAEFQVINIANAAAPAVVASADMTGTNNLNGVAYSSTKDVVVGASSSDTQEAIIFVPN